MSRVRATVNTGCVVIAALLVVLWWTPLQGAGKESKAIRVVPTGSEPGAHFSKDLKGSFSTSENLTLRLNTDLGSVTVVPTAKGEAPQVRYTVHLETDARQPMASNLLEHYVLTAKSTPGGFEIIGNLPPQLSRASNAQFWVHYEISVPSTYSLEITTGVGDIETGDIGGAATLVTEGGNIVTGQLSTNVLGGRDRHGTRPEAHPSAKLKTEGGHIQVAGAAGDLTAFTAGGHINTGFIHGEANLQSGGGHIRSEGIGGKAELNTEGGNITVAKAGSFVAVKTGGGQIDFGEVKGSVHAQTGGGGIRVMYVSGPMDVESSGGSICLTRVQDAVRAETGSGTITAWINPDASNKSAGVISLNGASQLSSGAGDIIVFIPRNLAANIEAVVEHGGENRIEADPALALQVVKSVQWNGPLKAVATLNGGGPVLKLRTVGGKIKLEYLESEMALWSSMMRDQEARIRRELQRVNGQDLAWPQATPIPPPAPQREPAPDGCQDRRTATWMDGFEIRMLGGFREDSDDFQRCLVAMPHPAYPDLARKAGVEGMVRLQVRMTKDGRVEVQKILEGDPVLAEAAIAAVKQWRGKPLWLDGKPVDVISTVSFEFHLREQ